MSTRPGNPTATPLADLALNEPPTPPADAPASASGSGASAGRARAFDRGYEPPRPRAPEVDPLELPLFEARPASGSAREAAAREVADRPLVSTNAPPRPPLAVRRPTGELPRARARVTPGALPPRVEEPRLELDLPDRMSLDRSGFDRPGLDRMGPDRTGLDRSGAGDFGDMPEPTLLDEPIITRDARDARIADEALGARASAASAAAADSREDDAEAAGSAAESDPTIAPLGKRAIAALIDLAFLAAIDATVLHFTLRLTGLTPDQAGRLPLAPLFGFLALLNGGYLTLFIAASGQTMGKMMTGVKVVAMDGGAVPFGHAVLRAILWLLTIVPLGIGALPAFLTDDRRALHDRLANTRVIKAE